MLPGEHGVFRRRRGKRSPQRKLEGESRRVGGFWEKAPPCMCSGSPCTVPIPYEALFRSCCSPQWVIFTWPFLITVLHSSFIRSVFTCWSLPMGSISSYVAFYFPFTVWTNQPQRGSVVHRATHTEAGLQLEPELLFSNVCCWNGCIYHSAGHASTASQTEAPQE